MTDTKKRTRGQYVKELVNEGAGMINLRIGVVTHAGPRQYSVCWESGFRRRYPQGYAHDLMTWGDWTDEERRKVQDEIFRHCGI
jgi:hypothetical protein